MKFTKKQKKLSLIIGSVIIVCGVVATWLFNFAGVTEEQTAGWGHCC